RSSARAACAISCRCPQEDDLAVALFAALEFLEAFRCGELRVLRFLDDDQCLRREPAALAHRCHRLLGQALAIGRIEEHEREWLERMRGAKLRGVAAKNA